MEKNAVLLYRDRCVGSSLSFSPIVSLSGFEKIKDKDDERFHDLMNELKNECRKLKVNFKAEIYDLSDAANIPLLKDLKN